MTTVFVGFSPNRDVKVPCTYLDTYSDMYGLMCRVIDSLGRRRASY